MSDSGTPKSAENAAKRLLWPLGCEFALVGMAILIVVAALLSFFLLAQVH